MTKGRLVIPAATVRAYERTRYRVDVTNSPFVLRPGESSEAIRRVHRRAGVSSSIFMTACNPFGQRQSDEDNAEAMRRLLAWLEQHAIRWIGGEGESTDEHWKAEPSVLALGPSVEDAAALCREFRQNAVVAIGDDAIPRLVFHPDASLPRGA